MFTHLSICPVNDVLDLTQDNPQVQPAVCKQVLTEGGGAPIKLRDVHALLLCPLPVSPVCPLPSDLPEGKHLGQVMF